MSKHPVLTYPGAVSTNGEVKLKSTSFRQEVGRIFAGCEIIIEVRVNKRKRSNRQNRYYWGNVVGMIRERLKELNGEYFEPEDIHAEMKRMFCKKSIVTPHGELLTFGQSTTELSTMEFEDYLEKVRQWANDSLDLEIPLPNEQREIDFL